MLYNLFEYLNNNYDLVGSGVFQYLSFRAGMAAIFSLIISILFGKKIIDILSNFQLSENIRDLDLDGQIEKKGTPTMGGIIILISILIPTILFADLDNIYIQIMLLVTVFVGSIGFFFVLFLLYSRTFPVIAQAELKTIVKSSSEQYKK